jgi:uncharacterized protein (TIGR00290 family)
LVFLLSNYGNVYNQIETMNKIKVSLAWSGGKDSAFALWSLLKDERYEVVSLHTTFGEESRRVGLHGIHESLIQQQAESIGLPLDKLYYPASQTNAAYEKVMSGYLEELKKRGVSHIAFGDIFLEDLKKYREDQLRGMGMECVFPLWGKDTKSLLEEFLGHGFKTLVCAADAALFEENQVGKELGLELVQNAKKPIDPCGENGEFHTFCFDGPIFQKPVDFDLGETISKGYKFKTDDGVEHSKKFWFKELKGLD